MDRKEFCVLMAKAKQESGRGTSDISFDMKMLLPTLRRFEKGEHNFNLKKVMEYLQVINAHIQIDKNIIKFIGMVGRYKKNTFFISTRFSKRNRMCSFNHC